MDTWSLGVVLGPQGSAMLAGGADTQGATQGVVPTP